MADPIVIPSSQKAAIQELAKLTEEGYGVFRQCLAASRLYTEPSALIEQTSKGVSAHTRLGGQILVALIGLRTIMYRANISAGKIAAGVVKDAEAKDYIPKELADVLSKRLVELLDTTSVAISAKAYFLVVADAAPFSDVRIVSDVRPIFSDKEELLQASGSIIVHHLRIEVGGEGGVQYAALTTSDLLKLKQTVERALEKDRKLRESLRGGPLAPLESLSDPTDKEI